MMFLSHYLWGEWPFWALVQWDEKFCLSQHQGLLMLLCWEAFDCLLCSWFLQKLTSLCRSLCSPWHFMELSKIIQVLCILMLGTHFCWPNIIWCSKYSRLWRQQQGQHPECCTIQRSSSLCHGLLLVYKAPCTWIYMALNLLWLTTLFYS